MILRATLFLSLMLLACFMPALSAHAQNLMPADTINIRQYSDHFYKRCHENPDPTLTAEGQEEYCVCLAAQLYNKTLLPEELDFLAGGAGVPMDKNKIMTKIYGPCIGIPGRAATFKSCTVAPKVYKLVKSEKDLDSMCRCVQQEMSYFWDTMAPGYLELKMVQDMKSEDPLQTVLNSPFYQKSLAKNRSKCLSKYGRRD